MKQILILVTILFTYHTTFSQGIDFEHVSFKEALVQAQNENKIVFIDCYTSWCGPCKQMAKNVFSQKEVGDFYNANFINLKMNMEKGEGPELVKKYNIKGFPTLLFIDYKGNEVHKVVGGADQATFINIGKTALDPSRRSGSWDAKYDKGDRDVKFLADYVKVLYGAQKMDELLTVGKEFLANTEKDDLINVYAFTVIGFSGAMEYGDQVCTYIINNKEKFIADEEIGKGNYDGVVGQCVTRHLNNYTKQAKSMEDLKTEIEKVKKNFEFPYQKQLESSLYNDFYIANRQYDKWLGSIEEEAIEVAKKDKRYASQLYLEVVDRIASQDEFNSEKELINKALEFASKSLELDSNANRVYVLTARLYKKLGDKDKGLAELNKFIRFIEGQGYPIPENIIELKKELE